MNKIKKDIEELEIDELSNEENNIYNNQISDEEKSEAYDLTDEEVNENYNKTVAYHNMIISK